jgi:aspartyl-tRNA(Asn)/glutamyl-tRNA(Gln) amidotransferase subunit A
LNPVLNVYLVLLHDSAMEAARAAEALFRAGIDLGLLQGIPVSVKDLIRVQGTRTTAGSRVLLEAPLDRSDAWVVRRLRAAGAIILGKTNLHEFAIGDPDPMGPFGLVQNPRRIGWHPGSSSSGAGAAVAAGLGVVGIGTDTGGSVRIPASLCGVVGLKPTAGRISLEGIIPLSWTLDSVGPLARRVKDLTVALGALKNFSSLETEGDFLNLLNQTVRGTRVGVPRGEFYETVQPAVRDAFEITLRTLRDLGCQLIDFEPPGLPEIIGLTVMIMQAEGSAYHERYRQYDYLYGDNFRERIFPGRELKALTYLQGKERQKELQQDWLNLSRGFEVLVAPGTPAVAPRHGVGTVEIQGSIVPFREALSRLTRPFNFLGWPALCLPNGINDEGLPTGVQIAGPPDSERHLLLLGHHLEQALRIVDKLRIEPKNPE